MTAAAEALARDEAAVTLARETHALLGDVGALTGAVAEWADDALAGGAPSRWVARQMIDAGRLIAAAARGEACGGADDWDYAAAARLTGRVTP